MIAKLFSIPGPWSGQLFIVSRPRGGDWLEDEAEAWRTAGLDVVVSLIEQDEAVELGLAGERGAAESRGIRFLSLPTPDRGLPPSRAIALSLLGDIVDLLESGKHVAVHCRQGIGRAGMMATGALILSGAGADAAIKAVSAARGREVPETPEQREWLRDLPAQIGAAQAL